MANKMECFILFSCRTDVAKDQAPGLTLRVCKLWCQLHMQPVRSFRPIQSGEWEVSSTLDALLKYIYAKGEEVNPTKVPCPHESEVSKPLCCLELGVMTFLK